MNLVTPVKNLRFAKWPLGDITQWYGENPELYSSMGINGHSGIDIVRPWGEHLFSPEDGVIVSVKDDPNGYGKNVFIVNKQGSREWVFGHNSENIVKQGDIVQAGQHIANMGNTGFVVSNSTGNGFWDHNPYTGTHCHFAYREIYIDNENGWSWPNSKTKYSVKNYDNGYKGRLDPVELYWPHKLKSRKLAMIASAHQSETNKFDISPSALYASAVIMKRVGL